MNTHLNTFYSILGKALALTIVGAGAFAQVQTGGAASLLNPQNLLTLIAETEAALAANIPNQGQSTPAA